MSKKDASQRKGKPARIEYEAVTTPDDAAGYLEALARGLREGRITIGGKSGSLESTVGPDVDLEALGRRGKRKVRIEITLKFRPAAAEDGDASAANGAGVSSGEPAQPATLPDEFSF